MAKESSVAVAAAFTGNAALAVLKGVAAFSSGSAAMLAETLHSVADTGNQALLFLGLRLAKRPPDAHHPFGHGRDVYFWAFIVAMTLFTLGGAGSIWEAVHRFRNPEPRESSVWAFAVLGAGFLFESGAFAVAFHSLGKVRRGRRLTEYWRDNRDPTIITVLLEDAAALLSLTLATAGLTLNHLTGSSTWDALASLLIGVVLLIVAGVLAFENYSLLLGEAAAPPVQRKIRTLVEADAAVVDLRKLRTMALGPQEFLVVLEVAFVPDLTAVAVAAAVRRLEDGIVAELEGATRRTLVVIEPAPPRRAARRAA
jgi:cation diffusion facilitator family transporter